MSTTTLPVDLAAASESDPYTTQPPDGMAAGGDHHAVLRSVVEAAAESIEEGGAALLLETTDATRLTVVAVAGSAPFQREEVVTIEGDQITHDTGEESIGLSWVDDPAAIGPRPGSLVAPVSLCGHSLGKLVLFSPELDEKRVATSVGRLEELAKLAAPAAALARADAGEVHLTELGAVVEVGQVLTGLLDMEDVLSYVVYLAESLVGGHCASVALLSDDGSEVVIGNSTGSLRGHEGESIPVTENLIGSVVTNGVPEFSRSLLEDERGFHFGEGLGPGVVVPITNVGKVIGAFIVARLEGARPFPRESAEVLQRMASYAAIAITNAETHRKQQEIAEALRTQAAELQDAYGELNKSQQQLLISEKMAALGRITAGIAHEINSPLSGIMNSLLAARGFVQEYETSIDDPEINADDHRAIAGDILNALKTAEGAVTKVAQFVKSIKSQTRAGEGGTTEFDPAEEVDATIVLLQHELKRRRIGLFTEMERGHRITGDQGKFGVVIQNLVSNALDAYDGEVGEVWIRLRAENDRVLISVSDQGSGIPEEIRDRIFDYLFTTKDVGKGTGLGLAMVHSVVTTNFNGEIALESEVGVGTTFSLSLPLTSDESNHGA